MAQCPDTTRSIISKAGGVVFIKQSDLLLCDEGNEWLVTMNDMAKSHLRLKLYFSSHGVGQHALVQMYQ